MSNVIKLDTNKTVSYLWAPKKGCKPSWRLKSRSAVIPLDLNKKAPGVEFEALRIEYRDRRGIYKTKFKCKYNYIVITLLTSKQFRKVHAIPNLYNKLDMICKVSKSKEVHAEVAKAREYLDQWLEYGRKYDQLLKQA